MARIVLSDLIDTSVAAQIPAEVAASVNAALGDLPTKEQLTAGALVNSNISAASNSTWIAPFPVTVAQFALTTWLTDVAASDTDYWTVEIGRYRANDGKPVATKTTQATGGAAITRRTEWNFDASTFHATYKSFSKGDIIYCKLTPTGSPGPLGTVQMTARYEPA